MSAVIPTIWAAGSSPRQEGHESFRARGQAIWDETGQITRMAGSLSA
jgi:hypothetical protein